jgi:hypothetical protein
MLLMVEGVSVLNIILQLEQVTLNMSKFWILNSNNVSK